MNVFATPLILVAPSKQLMKRFAKYYTDVTFWFENIFLLVGFFFYMMIHNPLIMIKTYFQIITKIDGFFNKAFYLLTWTIFGIFFLIYVNLVDTCMLINILCLDNSVVFD